MKTPEEIKNEYEQNHYWYQREQIDAGKLDYWGLTEGNRKAILKQCRKEARKYPSLRWRVSDQGEYPKKGYTDIGGEWSFHCLHLYYRRVDPLPEEVFTEEIAELNSTIKMLEKDLKEKEKLRRSTLDDLRKEQQLRAKAEKDVERLGNEKYAIQELVDSAVEDVERYKGQLQHYKGRSESLSSKWRNMEAKIRDRDAICVGLEAQRNELEGKLKDSRTLVQKCEKETTEALAEVEKYKRGLSKCVNDKLRLEKDLSRQKDSAKVATERVEELVKENKTLDKTIEVLRLECGELHEQVMDYLKDFHELAMRR